jgi:stage III sporulation protein AH
MLLKKQTVWLLTMLSLVVVLSVYYVTSPETNNDDLAFVEEDQEATAEENAEGSEEGAESTSAEGENVVIEDSTEAAENGTVISSVSSDDLFTALRLQMDDQRSKLVSDLQEIMASTDVSPEQKSDAFDKITEVQEVSAKERVLETLIKAESDEYKDVLVRADGESVRISLKSKNLTPAQANKIIQLVRAELGQKQVAVEFSN